VVAAGAHPWGVGSSVELFQEVEVGLRTYEVGVMKESYKTLKVRPRTQFELGGKCSTMHKNLIERNESHHPTIKRQGADE